MPQTVLLRLEARPWVRKPYPTSSESRSSCGVDLGEIDSLRTTEQSLRTKANGYTKAKDPRLVDLYKRIDAAASDGVLTLTEL
jgi:hypothetical protein